MYAFKKKEKLKTGGGNIKAQMLKSLVVPNFHWNNESELCDSMKSKQHIYKNITL